jgi:hypothetical protein
MGGKFALFVMAACCTASILFLAMVFVIGPPLPHVSVWERFQAEDGKSCVTGALKNDSWNELISAEIHCSFFDSNSNKVATSQGMLGNIPSGGVRVFKIPATVTNATIFNVDGVTVDQGPCNITVKSLH